MPCVRENGEREGERDKGGLPTADVKAGDGTISVQSKGDGLDPFKCLSFELRVLLSLFFE